MKNNSVTIKDVARMAGVSVGTVSHVLNGSPRHVGAVTRERVFSAARSLQYRPNIIARSMVKRATATIGLIITELSNPLFEPVTRGVESVLRNDGYGIVLASSIDMAREVQAVETLRERQVDGFIFMSLSTFNQTDHLLKLQEQEIPFVVINRTLEHPGVNRVSLNDFKAAYELTNHLLNLGHLNVATITGPREQRQSAVSRYEGWLQSLREQNLEARPDWIISGDYTYEAGYQAIRQLLQASEFPTALLVANESMAVGALKSLTDAGVRVPQDIAVVTIGDPPFLAYTTPALTTMALPVEQAGQIAARLLVDWLKDGPPQPARHILLDCELKIRESCGANFRALSQI
jgi:LacI family transcriptional regulator